MGQDSRARRDARRRARARATRVTPRGSVDDPTALADVIALIDLAARYAVDAPQAIGPRLAQLNEIGAVASSPQLDPAVLVVDEVLSRVETAYEHGWQPLGLVHAVRRQTTAAAATWFARAVLAEARRSRAVDRAPRAWVDQLHALTPGRSRTDDADELLPRRGEATTAQWVAALVVVDLLHRLPRSEVLVPPPSTWGQRRSEPAPSGGPRSEVQARMLTKVRALLAKAESTEFAAEAEALTAKAQTLMTRHSIDEALLAADDGGSFDVRGVRVLIDQPYALEKATLLHVVAEANRVRAIWNSFASCVTLVGQPTDVAQVDLLFTSVLVQATRAMTKQHDSGPAFRRAFIHAFAVRIGERLSASVDEATGTYGAALVPVLARQEAAVTAEFERLFPHVTSGSRRRQLDAGGWHAGTRAADAAVLPRGAVES